MRLIGAKACKSVENLLKHLGSEVDRNNIELNLSEEYEYEIIDDNTCRISKCRSASGDVVIKPFALINSRIYKVTEIGDYAFRYCSSLTSIEIPNSVTKIGDWAFDRCSSLREITSLAPTPPELEEHVFEDESESELTLKVPANAIENYKKAEGWKDFKNIVGI